MSILRVALLALLLTAIVPMVAMLLYASTHPVMVDGSFGPATLDFFREVLTSPETRRNILNTLIYAVGSAAVALVLGTLQAWIAERTDVPGRSLLYLAAILSLGVPYVLYTVAWVLLLGRGGPVNAILQAITGSAEPVLNVYSMAGLIFVEGMLWMPMAFLILTAAFRSADPSLEEASLASGASLPTTLRRITIPLVRPATLAMGLLVFIRALESFEVPAIIGMPGRVTVMTTDIYFAIYGMIPPNYGQAFAFAVILVVFVGLLLILYTWLSRETFRYQTITGKGFRPRIVSLGRWRPFVTGLMVLNIIVALVLPLAILLWAALLPFYQSFSLAMISRLTFDNFALVLSASSFRDAILNTVILGAGTATAVSALAAVIGWIVARRKRWFALFDQLAAVPLAFPAIVMGIVVLNLVLMVPFPLYGTVTSLVLASVVALLPYGVRYATVGVSQIHTELEDASAASGAGSLTTFLKVSVPLMAPALVSCWLLVFLLSVRAVSMVLILAGPDNQVVSSVIFDLWKDGQIGELTAVGMSWTLAMTVLCGLFFVIARRTGMPLQ